jgi:hypothetical protein
MLSTVERLAAERLAGLTESERDAIRLEKFVTVNVEPESKSGVWMPVSINPEILIEAERILRPKRFSGVAR